MGLVEVYHLCHLHIHIVLLVVLNSSSWFDGSRGHCGRRYLTGSRLPHMLCRLVQEKQQDQATTSSGEAISFCKEWIRADAD